MNKRVIPVVYATDYGYLRYTIVSMYSMLQNLNADYRCKIIVLVPKDISSDCDEIINRALSKFNNYSLSILRIGNIFDSVAMKISHITTPTYYRLLLPELLDEARCIYVDGDTIVSGDISELFNYDIGDSLLGGVRAFAFYKNAINIKERLEYPANEKFEYVNAGVLVFNLEEMRKDNTQNKFLSLLAKEYDCQDQDIINVACRGRIEIIPMYFNTMTKYALGKYSTIEKWASKEEFLRSKSSPVIIHYADRVKPWNDFNISWANKWTEICLEENCWPLFAHDKKELILSNISTRKLQKKKMVNPLFYLKKFGLKYAINRLLSGIKHR